MPNFSISNISREPDKPNGEYFWRFYHPETGQERLIPADCPDEAWKGIRWAKDEEWKFWILKGREDLIEKDLYMTETSVEFAGRNRTLVDQWDENDEEE